MKILYLIKYGELALKKKNKKFFEEQVIRNCKDILKDHKIKKLKLYGRFILEADVENDDEQKVVLDKIRTKIFGLASVSPGVMIDNDPELITQECIRQASEFVENFDPKTFRVTVKRPFKNLDIKSVQFASEIGSDIWLKNKHLKVNLKQPDMTIYAEILHGYTIVSSQKYNCLRGMPVGTAGKVGLLLSGGIDSPVAGYLAQKRGCFLSCIYFHSPPHTTQKAKDKVLSLAEKLKKYQSRIKVFVVNFTEIQIMLKKFTNEQYFVILGRRMMMRIANRIAEEHKLKAFVTGENLAQVSSQTLENLHCTNSVADLPILRPLISNDKEETVELARKIGTYDISILPYDDCCTLFLPPNPNTKAKVKYVEFEEDRVDIDALVNRAVETIEVIKL